MEGEAGWRPRLRGRWRQRGRETVSGIVTGTAVSTIVIGRRRQTGPCTLLNKGGADGADGGVIEVPHTIGNIRGVANVEGVAEDRRAHRAEGGVEVVDDGCVVAGVLPPLATDGVRPGVVGVGVDDGRVDFFRLIKGFLILPLKHATAGRAT